jgi:hypothetical protein
VALGKPVVARFNKTYSPQKEELEDTSLSPRDFTSVISIFTFYLYIVSCLTLDCDIGKFTIVAYLENLPFYQDLNRKSIKNLEYHIFTLL